MSGGTLQLSDGTFSVTGAINLASYVTLQGMGKATVISTATNAINMIAAIGTQGTPLYHVDVRDLHLLASDNTVDGIHYEWCHRSYIRNVEAFACAGSAIYLLCCFFPTVSDSLIEACGKLSTTKPAVHLASNAADSTNEGTMYNVAILSCYYTPLKIDGAKGIGDAVCSSMYIQGLQIEQMAQADAANCVDLDGSNNQIIGATISSAGSTKVGIANAGYGNKLMGIYFAQPIGTLITSTREDLSVNDIVAYGGTFANGINLIAGADHCTLSNIHLNGAFSGYGIQVASDDNILDDLELDATFTGESVAFLSGGDNNTIVSGNLSKAISDAGTGNKYNYRVGATKYDSELTAHVVTLAPHSKAYDYVIVNDDASAADRATADLVFTNVAATDAAALNTFLSGKSNKTILFKSSATHYDIDDRAILCTTNILMGEDMRNTIIHINGTTNTAGFGFTGGTTTNVCTCGNMKNISVVADGGAVKLVKLILTDVYVYDLVDQWDGLRLWVGGTTSGSRGIYIEINAASTYAYMNTCQFGRFMVATGEYGYEIKLMGSGGVAYFNANTIGGADLASPTHGAFFNDVATETGHGFAQNVIGPHTMGALGTDGIVTIGAFIFNRVGPLMFYDSFTKPPLNVSAGTVSNTFEGFFSPDAVATGNNIVNLYTGFLAVADVDDTPVDGATTAPISSNWAYDHAAATTGVHGVGAGTIAKTADITATKLDDFATPDANTDLNANTTNHGLLLQATAPASTLLNVVGIGNGETAYTNKALVDSTAPADISTAVSSSGSQVIAARRDHVHGIAANAVTLANLATQAAETFLANATSGAAVPTALALAEQTVAGRVTSGHIAGLTPTQLFYNLIMSVGITTDTIVSNLVTCNLSTSWQHQMTVDAAVTISLTDPTVCCVCRILLTKDDSATARTVAWNATTTLDHAANWIGGTQLTTMGTTAKQRYLVTVWRTAANKYIASYSDCGVEA